MLNIRTLNLVTTCRIKQNATSNIHLTQTSPFSTFKKRKGPSRFRQNAKYSQNNRSNFNSDPFQEAIKQQQDLQNRYYRNKSTGTNSRGYDLGVSLDDLAFLDAMTGHTSFDPNVDAFRADKQSRFRGEVRRRMDERGQEKLTREQAAYYAKMEHERAMEALEDLGMYMDNPMQQKGNRRIHRKANPHFATSIFENIITNEEVDDMLDDQRMRTERRHGVFQDGHTQDMRGSRHAYDDFDSDMMDSDAEYNIDFDDAGFNGHYSEFDPNNPHRSTGDAEFDRHYNQHDGVKYEAGMESDNDKGEFLHKTDEGVEIFSAETKHTIRNTRVHNINDVEESESEFEYFEEEFMPGEREQAEAFARQFRGTPDEDTIRGEALHMSRNKFARDAHFGGFDYGFDPMMNGMDLEFDMEMGSDLEGFDDGFGGLVEEEEMEEMAMMFKTMSSTERREFKQYLFAMTGDHDCYDEVLERSKISVPRQSRSQTIPRQSHQPHQEYYSRSSPQSGRSGKGAKQGKSQAKTAEYQSSPFNSNNDSSRPRQKTKEKFVDQGFGSNFGSKDMYFEGLQDYGMGDMGNMGGMAMGMGMGDMGNMGGMGSGRNRSQGKFGGKKNRRNFSTYRDSSLSVGLGVSCVGYSNTGSIYNSIVRQKKTKATAKVSSFVSSLPQQTESNPKPPSGPGGMTTGLFDDIDYKPRTRVSPKQAKSASQAFLRVMKKAYREKSMTALQMRLTKANYYPGIHKQLEGQMEEGELDDEELYETGARYSNVSLKNMDETMLDELDEDFLDEDEDSFGDMSQGLDEINEDLAAIDDILQDYNLSESESEAELGSEGYRTKRGTDLSKLRSRGGTRGMETDLEEQEMIDRERLRDMRGLISEGEGLYLGDEGKDWQSDREVRLVGKIVGGESIVTFDFNEKDLEEKFTYGSGNGGQKVNKTRNCVLLQHIPTGTIVKCHQTRSLFENRMIARVIMKRKLEFLKEGKSSYIGRKRDRIKRRKDRNKRRHAKKMADRIAEEDEEEPVEQV